VATATLVDKIADVSTAILPVSVTLVLSYLVTIFIVINDPLSSLSPSRIRSSRADFGQHDQSCGSSMPTGDVSLRQDARPLPIDYAVCHDRGPR
jgi:hypothetical protein